jgi:hypothetical protein
MNVAPNEYAKEMPNGNVRYNSLLTSGFLLVAKIIPQVACPTNGIVHIDFGTAQRETTGRNRHSTLS